MVYIPKTNKPREPPYHPDYVECTCGPNCDCRQERVHTMETPAIHIDNKETGGGADGFGFGGGGGLMGMILGAALFGGGFGNFGRRGEDGGSARTIETMTTDRDILETKAALSLQTCELNSRILESERNLEREIGNNKTAILVMGKDSEIAALRTREMFTGEINGINRRFDHLECKVNQIPSIVANVNARSTIFDIIATSTGFTAGQIAGLTAAANEIKTGFAA